MSQEETKWKKKTIKVEGSSPEEREAQINLKSKELSELGWELEEFHDDESQGYATATFRKPMAIEKNDKNSDKVVSKKNPEKSNNLWLKGFFLSIFVILMTNAHLVLFVVLTLIAGTITLMRPVKEKIQTLKYGSHNIVVLSLYIFISSFLGGGVKYFRYSQAQDETQKNEEARLLIEKIEKEFKKGDFKVGTKLAQIGITQFKGTTQKENLKKILQKGKVLLSQEKIDIEILNLSRDTFKDLTTKDDFIFTISGSNVFNEVYTNSLRVRATKIKRKFLVKKKKDEKEAKRRIAEKKKLEKKLAKEKKIREKRIAKFGKPPEPSAWDGTYRPVNKYLELTLKDPDSLKVEACSKVRVDSKAGWIVKCVYRAKNSFGGYVREGKWFVVKDRIVVNVLPANAYK